MVLRVVQSHIVAQAFLFIIQDFFLSSHFSLFGDTTVSNKLENSNLNQFLTRNYTPFSTRCIYKYDKCAVFNTATSRDSCLALNVQRDATSSTTRGELFLNPLCEAKTCYCLYTHRYVARAAHNISKNDPSVKPSLYPKSQGHSMVLSRQPGESLFVGHIFLYSTVLFSLYSLCDFKHIRFRFLIRQSVLQLTSLMLFRCVIFPQVISMKPLPL